MKNQCGICAYYHAERGDYGTCIATGEPISGYDRQECFTPITDCVVDRSHRQEWPDSVHGVYEAYELPNYAADPSPSSEGH